MMKVVCIKKDGFLEVGKVYNIPYQPNEFEIASVIGIWHDEIGETTIYNKENFVEINEWREIRLNELGIK